jgi:hypothetical protein
MISSRVSGIHLADTSKNRVANSIELVLSNSAKTIRLNQLTVHYLTKRRQEMKKAYRWFQIGSGLVLFVAVTVMTETQKVEASHPCQVIVTTNHCHKIGQCICPAGYMVHVH